MSVVTVSRRFMPAAPFAPSLLDDAAPPESRKPANDPGGRSGRPSLLDEAAAGPEDRVLIIGAPDAELMCDALRHGCRSAVELSAPPRRPEAADIVLAPRVVTKEQAGAIVHCARLALAAARSGRLAIGLATRAMARELTARLRDYGFNRIRLRARAEGDLLLLCRMPEPARATIRRRA